MAFLAQQVCPITISASKFSKLRTQRIDTDTDTLNDSQSLLQSTIASKKIDVANIGYKVPCSEQALGIRFGVLINATSTSAMQQAPYIASSEQEQCLVYKLLPVTTSTSFILIFPFLSTPEEAANLSANDFLTNE